MDEGRVRIASSGCDDPLDAMTEIISAIRPDDLAGLILFCSGRHALDRIGAVLSRLPGGLTAIGCTTAGEITPQGYADGSILGIGFPSSDFSLHAECLWDLHNFDAFAAQPRLVTLLSEATSRSAHLGTDLNRAALLLVDGLSHREELVANTVQHILGDLFVVGGSAGDDGRFSATHLLFEGGFCTDCAIVALLSSRWPLLPFRSDHHRPSKSLAVVTRADTARRQVIELNGVPAAAEYARLIGVPREALSPRLIADHPFMVKVGGQYFSRAIRQVDDSGIIFHSAIARGLVLRLGHAADRLERLDDTLAGLGGPDAIDAVLAFESAANRTATDAGDIATLSRLFADYRLAGFSTYGEQYRDMHLNRNLAGLAIGGRERR